jgi:hypothetical protein
MKNRSCVVETGEGFMRLELSAGDGTQRPPIAERRNSAGLIPSGVYATLSAMIRTPEA